MENTRPPDFPRGYYFPHTPETVIEAPVKSDLKFHACLTHYRKCIIDAFEVERERLLGKNVFARPRRIFDDK